MPPKKASSTTTTSTPSPEEELKTLIASAQHHYGHKDFPAAAELYSRAVELQANIHGEMAPENADLLYAYGRALYHVAVSKSDVLGGQVASEKRSQKKGKKGKGKKKDAAAEASSSRSAGDTVVEKVTEQAKDNVKESAAKAGAGKAYFQIEGDDPDWDTDEDEEDGEDTGEADGADGEDAAGEDAANEEADDDFAIAYEILDTARVLLSRQITALTNIDPSIITSPSAAENTKPSNPFSDAQLSDAPTRQLLDRLADVHDYQSEISLENENFPLAVSDARASLALKVLLHPFSSGIIAEMHLKLALALEMAAQTTTKGAEDDPLGKDRDEAVGVDAGMMAEAVKEMSAAVDSTKLRVKEDKDALAGLSGREKEDKQEKVKETESLLADLEARLQELKAPKVSLNATVTGPNGEDPTAIMKGFLGSLLGEAPEEQKKKIEEAKRTANDLTGMVKRKGKEVASAVTSGTKRKADDAGLSADNGKKARVEDVDEEDELA